jgi:dihydroorotase
MKHRKGHYDAQVLMPEPSIKSERYMLITNAVICDVNGERKEDVLIEDGKIAAIGSGLSSDEVIDAKGAYLLPGLVDTNVRLKDAHLNASTLDKVAAEAQKGGVTRLVLAPDCTPSINNSIVLEFVQAHQKREERVDMMSTIATVDEDERLSNIAILLKNGAMAPYMTTAVSNNKAPVWPSMALSWPANPPG